MKKLTLHVDGMRCDGCASSVDAALTRVEGVRRVDVSLDDERADLVLEDDVKKEALVRAVEEAGYRAR